MATVNSRARYKMPRVSEKNQSNPDMTRRPFRDHRDYVLAVRGCAAKSGWCFRLVSRGTGSRGGAGPGGQEHVTGQGLHHRNGPAAVTGGGEVAVAEGGQCGETEVLECLGDGGLSASEEGCAIQVLDSRVAGGEHQPDDQVGAQGTVDALDSDRGPVQHAAHDEDHGEEQEQRLPYLRGAVADGAAAEISPPSRDRANQRDTAGQPRRPAAHPRRAERQQQYRRERCDLEIAGQLAEAEC